MIDKNNPPVASGKKTPFLVKGDFASKRYPFPKEKDPAKKRAVSERGTKDYFLQVANAMYSSHLRNKTGINYADQQEFYTNRLYAIGEQSKQKYIEYFFKQQSAANNDENVSNNASFSIDGPGGFTHFSMDAKRKGWMNLLFEIVSDAPKIVSTLVRKYEKAEYDIVVDAIDQISGAEKENEQHKLWSVRENLEFNKEIYGNMGMEYQEPEFIPENDDEMALWEENGGFKPHHAMVQEKMVKHSLQYSDWKEVKKSMVEDAITNGYFASRVFWNEELGKAQARYVEISRFIIQYSKHKDFRDSEWAGEFIEVPMSILVQKGFKPEQLIEISKSHLGELGNPLQPLQINKEGAIETDKVDMWKVCVLDYEFITTDSSQQFVRENMFGKKKRIKQPLGTKNPKDNDKQKTKILNERTRYKACWIVGTNYIYDDGKAFDITRKSPKVVGLSYRAYRLGTKPIIKTLIPIFDNLMILWLKYQNAISLAINDGYAIDYDAISSIKMKAGETYSQEMVVQRFLQTGILIFKRKPAGNPRSQTSGVPVQHLPSNLATAFTSFREGFISNLQMIERLTGFTPMITGGAPQERAPVKTSEIAVDSTNDFLGNILSGYLKVKEEVAEELSMLIQIKIKQGWMEGYESVLSKKDINIIKIADNNKAKYGFKLIARPTELQRKEIYESAKISLANGRDGKPGITEADYFKIIQIIENGGSLKQADMILQASIRRAQREADKRAKENIEQTNQGNQALEQLKHNNAKELILIKGQEERKTEALKHENAKELIPIEADANETSPSTAE